MKRKGYFWLILSAGIMLLLHWLAVTCVRADAGMAAMLLLFFGINPAYCMTAGYYAGKQIHSLWWIPAASALLFLAGAWLFLDPGDSDFLTYTGIYFAVGMEAMLVSRLIAGRREKNG